MCVLLSYENVYMIHFKFSLLLLAVELLCYFRHKEVTIIQISHLPSRFLNPVPHLSSLIISYYPVLLSAIFLVCCSSQVPPDLRCPLTIAYFFTYRKFVAHSQIILNVKNKMHKYIHLFQNNS